MNKALSIILLHLSTWSFAQELTIPSKPVHISEEEYRHGKLILENSYQQLADDNYNIVMNDYWNFATAYSMMGQPKEAVYDLLSKAKFSDKESFCELADLYHEHTKGIDSSRFFRLLGDDYKELVSDCTVKKDRDAFDLEAYIRQGGYDEVLLYRLHALQMADQAFRKKRDAESIAKQLASDQVNILEAEAIIEAYGYPGKSMVGEKFDYVIWMVIQHADLSYQEKYLPLIAKTVQAGELNKTPLKMLLDRIYHKRTGSQLFGSQIGVPFADDKTIESVRLQYKL